MLIIFQLTNALEDIEKQLEELKKSGLLRGSLSPEQQRALISVTMEMKDAVTGAVHVQVGSYCTLDLFLS